MVRILLEYLKEAIQYILGTFFLDDTERSNRDREAMLNRLVVLQSKIDRLEESKISIAGVYNPEEVISEVEKQIKGNIGKIIKEKLEGENSFVESVDTLLIDRLDQSIEKLVDVYTKNIDLNDAVTTQNALNRNNADREIYDRLEEFVEIERASVSRLKGVMINLFVIFNLTLLLGFFFLGDEISPSVAYSVAASYFSLAAFIIYIVRTSHFRTGVLLSIRENLINQSKVYRYLESEKCSSPLAECDVDIIRMLMTNRTEREHRAQHPYEVVLKQIEGSNIQFKGGRMSFGRKETEVK